jgi:outer membrane protein OmpA-like peptidoglycan-associated protein
MDETDTRQDDDHLVINAYKEPPGTVAQGQGTGAEVRYGSGRSAFDQEMDISSQDIIGRRDNLLLRNNVVTFAHNRAELSEPDKTRLRAWIRLYQGSPTSAGANPTQITIQGYTSASGTEDYNLNLGLRRTEAVRNFISREGFTNVDSRVMEISYGEAYASETSTEEQQRRERRVELIVDSGEAQIVAAHEFGHAFGLGDEYASGFGGPAAGTRAGHDTLVKNMTDESGSRLPGAIRENTDSIMSVGNVVRPQHYATFDKALKQVTGVNEWSIRS